MEKTRKLSAMTQLKEIVQLAVFHCYSYILIGLLFIAFVTINGGIVLGDKSHHRVTVHWPQLVYFFASVACFRPAHSISVVWQWICFHCSCKRSSAFLLMLWTMFSIISVTYFSFAHIFVLSDNRHYTFYLYRRILNTNLKYIVVVPLSVVGVIVTHASLSDYPLIAELFFFVCVALSTVTSELIEPRYFINGFVVLQLLLLFRNHSTSFGLTSDRLHIFVYTAINAVTLYVFLCRPFIAPDYSVGRFMW
jgi:alpha-1,2-glucosyltransferase